MPKSFAQQIEDDENKIKRIREHQRMVRAKQAKQERNARTKRLVETGAIVEKARGGAYDAAARLRLAAAGDLGPGLRRCTGARGRRLGEHARSAVHLHDRHRADRGGDVVGLLRSAGSRGMKRLVVT